MDVFSPQTGSSLSPEHEDPKRRSSSRFLSKSVQRGLLQLKKDEHDQRVADLVKKNALFYKRQKICESFTTFTIIFCFTCTACSQLMFHLSLKLSLFSVFAIYLVLSYGFDYFCTPDFNLVVMSPSMTRMVGEQVKLMCRVDKYWEWCRYVPLPG